MNKKNLFRLLAALALSLSLCAGAMAEGSAQTVVWRVTEAEIDVDTLLSLTYTREDGTAAEYSERKDTDGGVVSRHWEAKDENANLFCSVGPSPYKLSGIQNGFNIVREPADSPYSYLYTMDEWNTVPEESGFTAPRADETVAAALDIAARLGLNGEHWQARPVFFSTLGRMADTTKSRKVLLEETLEGLPVRWSTVSLDDNRPDNGKAPPRANKCSAELVFSDEEGLLSADGNWCAFEPLAKADTLLSDAEIAAVFTAAGYQDPKPEACWFLHIDGNSATATLARRVENSYVCAVDGSWLQTGK